MFNFNMTPQNEALNVAISDLLEELHSMEGSNPDYADTSDQLIKLMKLKQDINPSWRPSPDALVGLAGTVVTTLLVLHFEKLGVITSKAFSFISRAK